MVDKYNPPPEGTVPTVLKDPDDPESGQCPQKPTNSKITGCASQTKRIENFNARDSAGSGSDKKKQKKENAFRYGNYLDTKVKEDKKVKELKKIAVVAPTGGRTDLYGGGGDDKDYYQLNFKDRFNHDSPLSIDGAFENAKIPTKIKCKISPSQEDIAQKLGVKVYTVGFGPECERSEGKGLKHTMICSVGKYLDLFLKSQDRLLEEGLGGSDGKDFTALKYINSYDKATFLSSGIRSNPMLNPQRGENAMANVYALSVDPLDPPNIPIFSSGLTAGITLSDFPILVNVEYADEEFKKFLEENKEKYEGKREPKKKNNSIEISLNTLAEEEDDPFSGIPVGSIFDEFVDKYNRCADYTQGSSNYLVTIKQDEEDEEFGGTIIAGIVPGLVKYFPDSILIEDCMCRECDYVQTKKYIPDFECPEEKKTKGGRRYKLWTEPPTTEFKTEFEVEKSAIFGISWVRGRITLVNDDLKLCRKRKLTVRLSLTANIIKDVDKITRSGILITADYPDIFWELDYPKTGGTDIIIYNVPVFLFDRDGLLNLRFRCIEYDDNVRFNTKTITSSTDSRFYVDDFHGLIYYVNQSSNFIEYYDLKTDSVGQTSISVTSDEIFSVSKLGDIVVEATNQIRIINEDFNITKTIGKSTSLSRSPKDEVYNRFSYHGVIQMDNKYPFVYEYKKKIPYISPDTWFPSVDRASYASSYYWHDLDSNSENVITIPAHVADLDLSESRDYITGGIFQGRFLYATTNSDNFNIRVKLRSSVDSVIFVKATPSVYSDEYTYIDGFRDKDVSNSYPYNTELATRLCKVSLPAIVSYDKVSVYYNKNQNTLFTIDSEGNVSSSKLSFIFGENAPLYGNTESIYSTLPKPATDRIVFSSVSDLQYLYYIDENKNIIRVNIFDLTFSIRGQIDGSFIIQKVGEHQVSQGEKTNFILFKTSEGLKLVDVKNPYFNLSSFNVTDSVRRLAKFFNLPFSSFGDTVLSSSIEGYAIPNSNSIPATFEDLFLTTGIVISNPYGELIASDGKYLQQDIISTDIEEINISEDESVAISYIDYTTGERLVAFKDSYDRFDDTNLTIRNEFSEAALSDSFNLGIKKKKVKIPVYSKWLLSYSSLESVFDSKDGTLSYLDRSLPSIVQNKKQNFVADYDLLNYVRYIVVNGQRYTDFSYGYLVSDNTINIHGEVDLEEGLIYNIRTHEYAKYEKLELISGNTYKVGILNRCYYNTEYTAIISDNNNIGMWIFLDEKLPYHNPGRDIQIGQPFRNIIFEQSDILYRSIQPPVNVEMDKNRLYWKSNDENLATGEYLVLWWFDNDKSLEDAIYAYRHFSSKFNTNTFNKHPLSRGMYAQIVNTPYVDIPFDYKYPIVEDKDYFSTLHYRSPTGKFNGYDIPYGITMPEYIDEYLINRSDPDITTSILEPSYRSGDFIYLYNYNFVQKVSLPNRYYWSRSYDLLERTFRTRKDVDTDLYSLMSLLDYRGYESRYGSDTLIDLTASSDFVELYSLFLGLPVTVKATCFFRYLLNIIVLPEFNRILSLDLIPPDKNPFSSYGYMNRELGYSLYDSYPTETINIDLMERIYLIRSLLDHFYDRIPLTDKMISLSEKYGFRPPFTVEHNDFNGRKITEFFNETLDLYWPYRSIKRGSKVSFLIAEYDFSGFLGAPKIVENVTIPDYNTLLYENSTKLYNNSLVASVLRDEIRFNRFSLSWLAKKRQPDLFNMKFSHSSLAIHVSKNSLLSFKNSSAVHINKLSEKVYETIGTVQLE